MIALDRLSVVTPFGIALSNKAFATTLQQISGVTALSLAELGTAMILQKTTVDLPLITAQTEPVTQATIDSLLNTLGTGTGRSGAYTINDILGTAAGVTAPQVASAAEILDSLNTADLQLIYDNMVKVLDGTYTIEIDPGPPPVFVVDITSGPGTGIYTTVDEAILALIALAEAEIVALVAAFPEQTTALNSDFNAIALQAQTDRTNQARAELVFADLTANSRSLISSFALTLPQYGISTASEGSTQYISATANTATLGGQAIIATLIQGSNGVVLSSVGIQTTTGIPLE